MDSTNPLATPAALLCFCLLSFLVVLEWILLDALKAGTVQAALVSVLSWLLAVLA